MKVVWSWLKDYVDLEGISPEEMAARWTLAGLEVEGITRLGDWWDRDLIVVGAVTRVEPHPDADRLCLAWVDWGAGEPHRCVTGAPNLYALREQGDLPKPMKIVFAREGAVLVDAYSDDPEPKKIELKGRKVRGIMSDAMVCSERELGISDEHEGILVLGDDAPVGAPLADVLGDAVIEFDLTANYAYAANMVGLARESAALLERPFTEPELPLETAAGGESAAELVTVEIEDPVLCPRYTARIIRDVTIGPSPAWMQYRLRLAGLRPISNAVDITNYAMLEWGEPLHAFDYDALVERAGGAAPTITVRLARPGETMTTLDDIERKLTSKTLLIADTAGPVAMAGVMGGADTEVGPETRNILLEAASFDFVSIRRATKHYALPSESAWRFGRDVPPQLAEAGSRRASRLLAQKAGGAVVDGVVDTYPAPRRNPTITMPVADFERLLGVAIPEAEIVSILHRLGFEASAEGGTLRATAPVYRVDQALPADLIEEVGRVYGYDRLPATALADPLPTQRDNPRLMQEEATRDALAAAGLQEIISYRFTSVTREQRLDAGRAPGADDTGVDVDGGAKGGAGEEGGDRGAEAGAPPYVTLRNPASPERAVMRRSILTGLLDTAADNLRFRERIALFEVGSVFHPVDGQLLPDEPRRAGLVMTGPASRRGWRAAEDGGGAGEAGRSLDFYDAKGAVEALLTALGVEATFAAGEHAALHPGRTAAIHAGAEGAVVGHVGELHPLVRESWELGDAPVAVAELDLDALAGVGGVVRPFVAFSSYPAVERDLAVVVNEEMPAGEVEREIRQAGGPLLVACQLFDVYRGEQLGAGKKSLAFSLSFQAPNKTLQGKAVDGMRGRIVKVLERTVGAEIR